MKIKNDFISLLKTTLFPEFRFLSLTCLFIIIHIVVFCLCLAYEAKPKIFNDGVFDFIQISQESLFLLGEKYPYFIIEEKQIWRFFLNPFLTANFFQLISVILILSFLGSYLEKEIGLLKYTYLLFFCAICPSALCCLVTTNPSIGGSFTSMGVIGCIQIHLLFQMRLEENQDLFGRPIFIVDFHTKYRKDLQFLIVFLYIFTLLSGAENPSIDLRENLIAILNGALLGLTFMGKEKNILNFILRLFPIIFLIAILIGLGFRNPSKI